MPESCCAPHAQHGRSHIDVADSPQRSREQGRPKCGVDSISSDIVWYLELVSHVI